MTLSTKTEIVIDKEFQSFLPPLTTEELDGLTRDIQKYGCREPLTVWKSNGNESAILLDGHNRLAICQKHHIPYETREISISTRQHVKLWICMNQLHKRNLSLNARSYYRGKIYEIEKEMHGGGQRPALKGNSYLLKDAANKTAKNLAKKEGVSEKTVRLDGEFARAVDLLEEMTPGTEREILTGAMTKKDVMKQAKAAPKKKDEKEPKKKKPSVTPAVKDYYTVEAFKRLSEDEQEAALITKPSGIFNAQKNESIEWAQWSWNPVTGCQFNCVWCYARDIAQDLYPTKFEPTLWPKKIHIPRLMTPPEKAKTEIGFKNCFVCSMADLFGSWVPSNIIETIIEECCHATEWNFLFLTKFPSRLKEFEFGENCWVGTSVDIQARVKAAEEAFRHVRAGVKWLSVEPMLENLQFSSLDMFDWIVVGGASASKATGGTRATPDYIPPTEWLGHIYTQAAKSGCKVYTKTNGRTKEYPGYEYASGPKDLQYVPDKKWLVDGP